MGNKWKWQRSGSQLSLLLLPSSQMPVCEDGSIHGLTPVRALLTHPVYLPLYCSLPLSYSDPKRPPYSLSHFCSVTLSPSYHISSLVLFPHFSCTVPHSTVGLSFPSLLYFFGHSLPHSVAYYLLYLACPFCVFTPSISCFLLPMQAQFPLTLTFLLPSFFFSLSVTFLLLLFYIPSHPSGTLTRSFSPSHSPPSLGAGCAGSSWVARWHCVSYQHSTAVPFLSRE